VRVNQFTPRAFRSRGWRRIAALPALGAAIAWVAICFSPPDVIVFLNSPRLDDHLLYYRPTPVTPFFELQPWSVFGTPTADGTWPVFQGFLGSHWSNVHYFPTAEEAWHEARRRNDELRRTDRVTQTVLFVAGLPIAYIMGWATFLLVASIILWFRSWVIEGFESKLP